VPVIPALRRRSQVVHHKFKTRLGYIVRHYLKKLRENYYSYTLDIMRDVCHKIQDKSELFKV
jgi:hypothetical protein